MHLVRVCRVGIAVRGIVSPDGAAKTLGLRLNPGEMAAYSVG
jgi:hypothetical protein